MILVAICKALVIVKRKEWKGGTICVHTLYLTKAFHGDVEMLERAFWQY